MAYDTFEELGDLALPVERQKLNDMLSYLYLKMQGGIGSEEVDTLSFSKLVGDSMVLGGADNVNGAFAIKDAADNVIAEGNEDGITVRLPARGVSAMDAPFAIADDQAAGAKRLAYQCILGTGDEFFGLMQLEGDLELSATHGGSLKRFRLIPNWIDGGYIPNGSGVIQLSPSRHLVFYNGDVYVGDGTTMHKAWTEGTMPITSGTWTPTFTGFSTAPTGVTARYRKIGNVCECWVRMLTAGTSDANTFAFSLPFTAATVAGMIWGSTDVRAVDNGAAVTTPCMCQILSGGTTAALYTTLAGGGWTTTGNKHAQWVHYTYETA